MGCLSVNIRRVGGGSASMGKATADGRVTMEDVAVGSLATMGKATEDGTATMSRIGRMSVAMGLVCTTDVGAMFLWASDELLITLENGRLIVNGR